MPFQIIPPGKGHDLGAFTGWQNSFLDTFFTQRRLVCLLIKKNGQTKCLRLDSESDQHFYKSLYKVFLNVLHFFFISTCTLLQSVMRTCLPFSHIIRTEYCQILDRGNEFRSAVRNIANRL